MNKFKLLVCSAMIAGFSNAVLADTQTDDSTNTYTPSSQYNDKLHQKPVANDANSGSDMSTTKDSDTKTHKKHHKVKKDTSTSTSTTTTTN